MTAWSNFLTCVNTAFDAFYQRELDSQLRTYAEILRHQRAAHPRTGHIRGTGLGLAIVRHAVNVMGARIDVHSRPGEGTRIDVHLSLAK